MKQSNNVVTPQFNFTHNFSYDHDLAQIWLDDFMKGEDQKQVRYFGHDNDYMVIFANETIMNAPHYKISHLRKMKRDDLMSLWIDHNGYWDQGQTKSELIDDIMNVSRLDYYTNHFEQTSWHDLESDFIIHGHCQGDAQAVKLVSDKKNKFEYEITSDHLENLFYNQPLYLRFDVYKDGEEILDINAHEFMNDPYNLDKQEIIECLKKHYANGEFLNALCFYVENNVSDYPSY